MLITILLSVAVSLFLIITGILFLQGKCEKLAMAFMPKQESFDTAKLLPFTGAMQIVLGVAFLAVAGLLYFGYYQFARIGLLVIIVFAVLETIYEFTAKRFRK